MHRLSVLWIRLDERNGQTTDVYMAATGASFVAVFLALLLAITGHARLIGIIPAIGLGIWWVSIPFNRFWRGVKRDFNT